jgi:hypothetical protein
MALPLLDEFDIVRRALILRKRKRIGILWAEGGVFWISESEYDPRGSRLRITLAGLRDLVVRMEADDPPRKPAAREEGAMIPVLGMAL